MKNSPLPRTSHRLVRLVESGNQQYLYLNLLHPAAGVFQTKVGWAAACERRELMMAAPQVGLLLASWIRCSSCDNIVSSTARVFGACVEPFAAYPSLVVLNEDRKR
jgi:hypothetical protein